MRSIVAAMMTVLAVLALPGDVRAQLSTRVHASGLTLPVESHRS